MDQPTQDAHADAQPKRIRDLFSQRTFGSAYPAAEYDAANTDDSREALIAVGNVRLPLEAGGRGGLVSVKAVGENAGQFVGAIFDAVPKWRL
ncbi:MAG: hypothetical protein HFACDABA_00775 [Anaerolineales bacterium]|nr:hypothetical protein [Anaerolineales bacterium]